METHFEKFAYEVESGEIEAEFLVVGIIVREPFYLPLTMRLSGLLLPLL